MGAFLTGRTRARTPPTPSPKSSCQTWCLCCLWKPSPGGLSMGDPTPPKRLLREPPCLPLHSLRKRAPGTDPLHARTAGQGALRGMPVSGCSRSFTTRFPGALETISTCIIVFSSPLREGFSLHRNRDGIRICWDQQQDTGIVLFSDILRKLLSLFVHHSRMCQIVSLGSLSLRCSSKVDLCCLQSFLSYRSV